MNLFAIDRTRWGEIANSLRPRQAGGADTAWFFAVMIGLVLALGLFVYFYSRRERREVYASPAMLFWSLCRIHKLRWRDRWLLWQAARGQRLRDPARMFVDSERFNAERLGRRLAAHPRLAMLRQQLFGAVSSSEPAAASVETPVVSRGPNPLRPVQPRPTLDLGGSNSGR